MPLPLLETDRHNKLQYGWRREGNGKHWICNFSSSWVLFIPSGKLSINILLHYTNYHFCPPIDDWPETSELGWDVNWFVHKNVSVKKTKLPDWSLPALTNLGIILIVCLKGTLTCFSFFTISFHLVSMFMYTEWFLKFGLWNAYKSQSCCLRFNL